MIRIQFPNPETERAALGFLAGRFSFKSFDDGTTLVPEAALGHLAAQGLQFTVAGRAIYGQFLPAIRDPAAPVVQ
jgi:hypothetical protein